MTHPEDAFTLTFPARSGFLRICRMTTMAFAADINFDVDEIDDLRLAVDEAVTWLLGDETAGGEVSISLVDDGAQMTVRGERHSDDIPERSVDDLVHAILGATLDHYELASSDGHRSLELQKAKSTG